MSILVTERWSTPKLSYGAGGLRANRGFDVTGVTTKAAAIAAVVAFDPRTAYNAQHPESTLMYVDSQDAEPPGLNVWHVKIGYSSTPAGRHPDPLNPLMEPPEYNFIWGFSSEAIDQTTSGKLLTNSAIEPFGSAPPAEILNGTLVVERNEPFYDARAAVALSNTVNSQNVVFAGTWLLEKGQACARTAVCVSPITRSSVYSRVRYTIELRGGFLRDTDGYWDGFKLRILDASRRGWVVNALGKTVRGNIVETNTSGDIPQQVSTDVLLDGTGKPLDSAWLVWNGSTSGAAVASPIALPAEVAKETTLDASGATLAVFLKYFPRGIRLGDLNSLGL